MPSGCLSSRQYYTYIYCRCFCFACSCFNSPNQIVYGFFVSIKELKPDNRDAGNLNVADTAVEMVKNGDNGIPVPNYTDENVSTKVVKLIQSYTGVVNKMVWRK